MGGNGSKSAILGFNKKTGRVPKTHLETDIKCPGCQLLYPKGTPFEVVTM